MAGSTTRLGFAIAFLSGVGGAHSADALHVVVAWQMAEGQTANENDPLANLNTHSSSGDKFAFPSIDNAVSAAVGVCAPGHVYQSIGDAFRAGKSAPDLINAIQAAGWCGGPKAPCPGYGALIRSNYNRLQDAATYQRESMKLVGNTAITGAPAHFSESDGITTGDVVNSLPGAGIVKGFANTTDAIAAFVSKIMDPDFWKRAGVFALGAALAFWGLVMLGHGMAPNVTGAVKKVAGAAALA